MKKKKALLKKIGIMLALIFSFLLSIIPTGMIANASSSISEGETIKDTIRVLETKRSGNTISFKVIDKLDIRSITYEYVYKGNDNVNYAELVTDNAVSKKGDYEYSFDVSSKAIGVKIWKVKYYLTNEYFKNKMTIGSNSIGDITSEYKKNYVEVVADKLDHIDKCVNYKVIANTCDKLYVFYFNLDTEIDKIEKLSLEYSIKTLKKRWWAYKTTSTKSYEIDLNYDQKVIDVEDKSLNDYLSSDEYTNKIKELEFGNNLNDDELLNYLFENHLRPVLGENKNGNGYSWYVQPMINDTIVDKEDFFKFGYDKTELQEVAIVKMSYWSHGDYFEDIPVLDEDTGWFKFKEEETNNFEDFLKDLIEFLKDHWYLIPVVIIALPVLAGLLVFILFLLLKSLIILIWRFIKWLFLLPFKIGKKKIIRINNSDMTIDKKNHVKENINKHGYNRNTDSYKY